MPPVEFCFGTSPIHADTSRAEPARRVLAKLTGSFFSRDVAEAVARILADPGTVGRTYELAGPGVYTLRDLRFTLRVVGKRRLLMPLPFTVAKIQARLFELLPTPPLTTGQVDLLKADSVASGALPGLRELNIPPKAIEEVVPTYIGRSLPGV